MLSSLFDVRLVYWILPHLNIPWTSLVKQIITVTVDGKFWEKRVQQIEDNRLS